MIAAKRRARVLRALQSLPGGAALVAQPQPFQAARDNDLARAGLARPTADGFELTPQGQALVKRAAR